MGDLLTSRCHDDYWDSAMRKMEKNAHSSRDPLIGNRQFLKGLSYYWYLSSGGPAKGALFSSNPKKTGDAQEFQVSLASLCGLEKSN